MNTAIRLAPRVTFNELPLTKSLYRLNKEVAERRIIAPNNRKTLRCDVPSETWFDWLEEQVQDMWKNYERTSRESIFSWGKIGIYCMAQRMRKCPNTGANRSAMVAIERGDYCCRICGQAGDRGVQTDHIVPKADGGKDELPNYQLACSFCNPSEGRTKGSQRYARGKTTAVISGDASGVGMQCGALFRETR